MSGRMKIVRKSLLLVFLVSCLVVGKPIRSQPISEPFFTLEAITGGDVARFSVLNLIDQHLARIGIDVHSYYLEWSFFLNEMINLHNFDFSYTGFMGGAVDPDYSLMYGEDSFLNFAGYNSSMDYEEELGMGRNQWYLEHGITIMPPDSEERIEHYWEWQDYYMDKILAIQPTLLPKGYYATWSNLHGYDPKEGLKNCFGKLSWDGLHTGQESTSELVIAGDDWYQLNPFFSYFSPDGGITNYILDCLATYDFKRSSYYPHLAYNWTMLSDTHARVNLRQGIKWNIDPYGYFPNEYFDADDVIFSYYVWRFISDYKSLYTDIEDVKKVDQYTVDFYFDSDPLTPEKEPTAKAYSLFTLDILPEHYLNQTQLPDGKTPDITHNSWHTFASECFGTGLFELDDFLEIEVTLNLYEDSWWLDPSVDKTNMDFENRFGNFSGGLDRLEIRKISDPELKLVEFQRGKLDYAPLVTGLDKRDEYRENPEFNVYSMYTNYIEGLFYNLREDRAIIGSQEPAPGDPSITKGLAIRKAISYAINRDEINQVLFGGELLLQDHPISIILGKWCNPDIIRYNHNLDKAREYMQIAGYGEEELIPSGLSGWEIAGIVVSSVVFTGAVSFVIYWLYRKGK